MTFVVAVLWKLQTVKQTLGSEDGTAKSFNTIIQGLGDASDVSLVQTYLDGLRVSVAGSTLAKILEGRQWKETNSNTKQTTVSPKAATLSERVPPKKKAAAPAKPAAAAPEPDAFYSNSQGFLNK